jgi:hypothetical protein
MKKQYFFTLDDLYQFFVHQNKSVNFSSKETQSPIVVSVVGNFSTNENEMPGMLGIKLKVCHTETNRNGSHISKANMENAMPTLKYRPILAYIHEVDGVKDFYAHNMEIVENEDGETDINYIEKQVGCFTADDPWLEYDEEADKTYVMAYAVIPEEYTEAADIIRRKNGTKVSCELVINELSYNAKEKYLDLTDFYFGGCTLLGIDDDGNEIGEGMLGARADIADFCHKEPVFTYQEKLIETLDKLNVTLSSFNISNLQKGGNEEMDNIETVVMEDSETVVEETVVEETVTEQEEVETTEEVTSDDSSTSEDGDEDVVVVNSKKQYSTDEHGNVTISFEISHEDIRGALFNLLGIYEEEDNEWYWVTNVYDDYFIFENWAGDKLYKQSYAVDGDNVSLSGDRQEVFKMILTESEKLAIEKMREDYSALEAQYNALKEVNEQYESAKLHSQREAILAAEEYSMLSEDVDFKTLIENMDKFSLEELSTKADLIFAKFAKSQSDFAVKDEKKPKVISFNFNTKKETKKQPYGNLFSNK